MSVWSRALGIALVGLALVPTLSAQGEESLSDKEYWDGQDKYMKDTIDAANKKCGTSLTFEWTNKALLRAKADGGNNGSPNGICGEIFNTLWGLCGDSDDAKRRVAQKIKSVSCGYADTRTLTLGAGRLAVMTNNKSVFNTWAREQLGNKL
jgi:hypothetical protein